MFESSFAYKASISIPHPTEEYPLYRDYFQGVDAKELLSYAEFMRHQREYFSDIKEVQIQVTYDMFLNVVLLTSEQLPDFILEGVENFFTDLVTDGIEKRTKSSKFYQIVKTQGVFQLRSFTDGRLKQHGIYDTYEQAKEVMRSL